MIIYLGTDHRGYKLKEVLREYLKSSGYEVVDMGNEEYDEADDYPTFAQKVAEKIMLDPKNSRGIVFCGSGAGMDIVVNKFQNVRSVLAINSDQVASTRTDDDTNVLSLAADYITEEEAKKIVSSWLTTPFDEKEGHKRRLREIELLELNR